MQALPSSQLASAEATHLPPAQLSPMVQALPSLHGPVLPVLTQPLAASHASSVHGLPSLQFFAFPGEHLPSAQVSPSVHTLPSLHGAELLTLTQPLMASHRSVVQSLPSSQSLAGPALQLPFLQVSPSVQALPSLQAAALLIEVQPDLA